MPPATIGCGAYGASVTGPGLGTPSGAGSGGSVGVCADTEDAAIASANEMVESDRVMRGRYRALPLRASGPGAGCVAPRFHAEARRAAEPSTRCARSG